EGTIPLDRFVPLLERICEVVHSAHEQGIIHRDLKPANVLVLSRANRYLPKLLDFGIARVLGDGDDLALTSEAPAEGGNVEGDLDTTQPDSAFGRMLTPVPDFHHSLTRRGAILGSPRYMAPEQWVDVSKADARTDLYAVAALSYEALTGRPP